MATTPEVYFGLGGGSALWRVNVGYLDGPTSDGADPPVYTGGAAYHATLASCRIAPSGPRQNTVFASLLLVVTHDMAVTVRMTPILDGVPYDGTGGTTDERRTINLTAKDDLTVEKFLLPLEIPLMVDAVERGRYAMRGTWFQARVETTGALAAGTLIFEAAVLEHEPAEDSITVTP